ncbi:MAG: type I-B CRISPR-associated protein Cas7/Cst2/DevR [Deltaproteobacteria bacterium]|nr:type I-B CRISPR-associated protein Cas7/Cst2/DevR [Deltaproteobacteria bacterium]
MKLPCNRSRLHDEGQLAVQYEDYPDKDRYIDDFFMGWFIAAGEKDRKAILKELKGKGRTREKFTFKRDSVLRVNVAEALEPCRHDSLFTQSPLNVNSPWQNTNNSGLLYRDVVHTAFQYPFALNLDECREKSEWCKALLQAVGELRNVAGNHARSYFEMSPASIVVRLTPRLVAGYGTYGFEVNEGRHTFPEVIENILEGVYPGSEFFIGGKITKDMDTSTRDGLVQKGTTLDRSPQRLLETVGHAAFSS